MPKLLKRALLTIFFLCIFLVCLWYAYFKYLGLIPSHDYETVPPTIPEMVRPAILVLTKTNGFVHRDAIPAGEDMLQRIAERNQWGTFTTKNAATHSPEILEKFDVIVWSNVSGDVLTEEQRQSMKSWIEAGGAWVGIHAAGGDKTYKWRWYVDTLLGAQFVGHTMDPQFQDADLHVTDPNSPITRHLPPIWTVPSEEWYAFDRSPRDLGYNILLTLDESSYTTVGKTINGQDQMEGEHPASWAHKQGEGKVFYTAIGHQADTYSIPEFEQLVENAIKWTMN